MVSFIVVGDPGVMAGKPIIKGRRITVEYILRKAAGGYSTDQLLAAYPHLTLSDLTAVFQYAADVVASEQILEAA